MWLLSTDRAELHRFYNPEDVPGGYAILSHVWDKDEQSFRDIQELRILCSNSASDLASRNALGPVMSTNPRDHTSAKIRDSCIIAEEEGYEWIWNDTCCIDKASSFQAAEAINGMFGYYSCAEVCFAYLGDVSLTPSLATTTAEFRASKWHTRGWTLPELIAPTAVFFLSRDWTYLGSKHDFAPILESVTRVPASVLTGEEGLSNYSVVQRMSWASGRETTREEDRAYSLMGILGVNMSVRYGEGAGTFQRLQRKIARKTVDVSLFSWGRRLSWSWFCQSISAAQPRHAHYFAAGNLLSPSPDHFQQDSRISSGKSLTGIVQDACVEVMAPFTDIIRRTLTRSIPASASRRAYRHVSVTSISPHGATRTQLHRRSRR